MVDVNVVNDDIANILESDAATAHNMNVSPTAIDSFVAIEDELLRQFNHHITGKHNPQWLRLNHGVSESTRFRVHGVVVRGVGDDVEFATLASLGVLTEPNGAFS